MLNIIPLLGFQDEGVSRGNFFARVFKLVLNVIAVLLLAGGISLVIKVWFRSFRLSYMHKSVLHTAVHLFFTVMPFCDFGAELKRFYLLPKR